MELLNELIYQPWLLCVSAGPSLGFGPTKAGHYLALKLAGNINSSAKTGNRFVVVLLFTFGRIYQGTIQVADITRRGVCCHVYRACDPRQTCCAPAIHLILSNLEPQIQSIKLGPTGRPTGPYNERRLS